MTRFYALTLVVLSLALLPVHAQQPRASQQDEVTPGTPLNFQVRVRLFEEPDTIQQLYLQPQTQEVIRIYRSQIPLMAKDGSIQHVDQQGLIRENGNRVDLPQGEFFFSLDQNYLFTESFRLDRNHLATHVILKKYAINKLRLIPLGSLEDSLKRPVSPRWHFFKGDFVVSNFATFLSRNSTWVLTAWSTPDPSMVRLDLHQPNDSAPERSFLVNLGRLPGLGLNNLQAFGLREAHLTEKHIILHCVYQTSTGQVGHLFSGLDTEGRLLWESTRSGEAMMRSHHSHEEIFTLSNRPVFHQFIHCFDAETGALRWEKSLYELYNNDPKFEFDVIDPQELVVQDVASVLEGQYLGLVLGRKPSGASLCQDNRLLLFDRMGRLVYRYEIPETARFFKIKDLSNMIGLATEKAVHRFWQ